MSFVSADDLKVSVQRLGTSRASKGFVDFLIVKRGLSVSGSDRLAMGVRSQALQQATDELMACKPEVEDAGNPFINVFGTGNHSDHGYRSPKYRSNGTSVTVPRWTDVFDVVARGPAVVKLLPDYLENLTSHVLTTIDAPLPQLSDAAVWYHRFTDLGEKGFDLESDLLKQMVEDFTEALGLAEEELELLFETTPPAQASPESGAESQEASQ